jgi:hypothetical protein
MSKNPAEEGRMEKRRWMVTGVLVAACMVAGCLRGLTPEPGVPKMTKEELKGSLGKPDVIIVDVRTPEDWNKSQQKIIGALRENPEKDIRSWATRYPKDKTLVFYCA